MRVQLTKCVVLLQAVSTTCSVKQGTESGDGAVSFKEVCPNSSFAAEETLASHAGWSSGPDAA